MDELGIYNNIYENMNIKIKNIVELSENGWAGIKIELDNDKSLLFKIKPSYFNDCCGYFINFHDFSKYIGLVVSGVHVEFDKTLYGDYPHFIIIRISTGDQYNTPKLNIMLYNSHGYRYYQCDNCEVVIQVMDEYNSYLI
jgi:hypothetical protein